VIRFGRPFLREGLRPRIGWRPTWALGKPIQRSCRCRVRCRRRKGPGAASHSRIISPATNHRVYLIAVCVASESSSSSLRFAQIKQVTSNISMPPAIDFGTLGGVGSRYTEIFFPVAISFFIEILQLAIARTGSFISHGIRRHIYAMPAECAPPFRFYFILVFKRSIRSAPFVTVPVTVRLKPISARHGTWSSGLYYVDTIEMRPDEAGVGHAVL
jgi:hypothetical protein